MFQIMGDKNNAQLLLTFHQILLVNNHNNIPDHSIAFRIREGVAYQIYWIRIL